MKYGHAVASGRPWTSINAVGLQVSVTILDPTLPRDGTDFMSLRSWLCGGLSCAAALPPPIFRNFALPAPGSKILSRKRKE